jgi:hypothetical protein
MKKNFFAPNITRAGRIARLIWGLIMLVAGIISVSKIWWLGGIFFVSAAFAFYEASRSWCVLRACGVKTKY